jgi:hypothetical protein
MGAGMLTRPMLTAALLAMSALISLPGMTTALRPPARPNLVALPAEPGSQVLTDAPTVQAVVADLDGDEVREIVALTMGEDASVALEAWTESGGAWTSLGPPLPVPPEGSQPGPVRLVVRNTADGERVTLARQPLVPGASAGAPCCLHLEDVLVSGGLTRFAQVAEPLDAFDALFVLDLDGDGVDELFGSRSLPPLGDISYPTASVILRWNGKRFDPPALAELPIGSGDTPFLLGETDGLPGEEVGIIATLGRPELHRVALAADGTLRVDDAGISPLPTDVAAVPLASGAGLALLTGDGVMEVRPWPAGGPIGEPIARTRTRFAGSLLGTVEVDGRSLVALRQSSGADALHLRELPMLTVPPGSIAPVGPAAPTFGSAPVLPYVGPLPGGGPDGGPALVVAGRMVLGGSDAPGAVRDVALLAGAAPVGLAGAGSSWVAIHHLPAIAPPEPAGGRFGSLQTVPGSGLTVAPLGAVAAADELGDATFAPTTTGGIAGTAGSLDVGPGGFRALVEAPAGSRVHVAGLDPTVVAAVLVVGPEGRVEVPMVPPVTGIPNPRYRAALSVTTPAGHSYVATWDVRVATEAPALEVAAFTPLGSAAVVLRGTTVAGSTVTVGGVPVRVAADGGFEAEVAAPPWPTDVVVTAAGPFGAESEQVLSAVGFFDYRALPWIGIVAAGLALVAVILAIRIPQRTAPVRRADDDAVLEELDED